MDKNNRCPWSTSTQLYIDYHDQEWGVAVRNDAKQFEFLVLESAQAGLSWLTILKRREHYRRLYLDFNAEKVARFGGSKILTMMQDEGIIRNFRKIEASVNNAQCFLEIISNYGSFSSYLWDFVDGKQVNKFYKNMADIPANTPLSDRISKDLKQKGFRFLGSTIIYAHLQATGLVNDHLVSCFRHNECME